MNVTNTIEPDAQQMPASSQRYWRSLSELEGTPEFEQFMHREFPQAASEFPEGVSRRRWMKLMSASLALGGLTGCRYSKEEIAAFVVRPVNSTPGVAKHYATNFELAGRAVHLLVGNVDGRPLKIEGNPQHPLMKGSEPNDLQGGKKDRFASAGTDVFSQACILGLYDPDRAQRVASRSGSQSLVPSTWAEFSRSASDHFTKLQSTQGESLAILMSPSLSPSVNRMVAKAISKLPKASVYQYESVDNANAQAALKTAVGQSAELLLKLDAAKVICCLDSDILGLDPNSVLHARQFSKGREAVAGKMNRLYSVESRYSVTGAAADTRLPVRSAQVAAVVAGLEKRVDELLAGGHATAPSDGDKPFDKITSAEKVDRCIEAMAEDLVKHQGAGVVSVGTHQPLDVQLAAIRLNKKLGNIGKTVMFMPNRTAIEGVKPKSMSELIDAVNANKVDTVWILGDNPVYTAPSDIDLTGALKKVATTVYCAAYEDETSAVSTWSLPLAHALESWGDVRGVDGSYGVCQPQIEPLLGGKSVIEILGLLQGAQIESGLEIVRATADLVAGKPVTKRVWDETLHNGFLASVTSQPIATDAKADGSISASSVDMDSIEDGQLEVVIYPSDTLYDGRFSNNVWLQELPQVITRLVWDNAALVSPKTAAKFKLEQGTIVKLAAGGRSIELPVFIVPGQANGSIAVHLGYGRKCLAAENNIARSQDMVGHDVNPLRTSKNMSIVQGVETRRTTRPYSLATTQDHFTIDKGGAEAIALRTVFLIREGTLEQVEHEGYTEHLAPHSPPLESLSEEPLEKLERDPTVPYAWGMTVDLNKCVGCNACVVACQAENNVPVVGKEQVLRGREMHWLRIDRYFKGDTETPKIVNQPVACVHCETAPCEQVCPVAATVHTEEGINAMAYNRCIGTRYCANNCPYKVRRFNYFNFNRDYGQYYGWQDHRETANRKLQQLVLNPDVSLRGRGIMEKCTYCIQRVQNGKIDARNAGRPVEDGEIQTACQSACPSQAIVFGDLKDPASRVSQLQKDQRAYAMLAELNIKPRTLYLTRVRNVHPRLKTSDQLAVAHDAHGTGGEIRETHPIDSGKAHGEHS